MTILLKIQVGFAVFGALLVAFFAGQPALWSFAGGAAVTLFNFAVLVYVWPVILAKKQVAPGIGVIIFKFAILGWILYLVAHSQTVRLGWFACGLATVLPSVLVTAFMSDFSDDSKEAI